MPERYAINKIDIFHNLYIILMSDKTNTNNQRGIAHRFPADARREGAGTHITRWFVPTDYALTDPFLLFDETKSDKIEEYASGFPEHPHRGFEALTYIINGTLRHKDSAGYSGFVGPCGAQWLTNASGLTHDEVPDQTEGMFWCMQLWINLPAENKSDTPFYEEIKGEQVPVLTLGSGSEVRVVAGQFENIDGLLPSRARPSRPVYLDVVINAQGEFNYTPPEAYTVLIFVVEGQITINGDDKAEVGETLLLAREGSLEVQTNLGARLLLMAGRPINEKIAWHGPFVMNNESELKKAFADFLKFGPFQPDTGTGIDNTE
jgi:redox-sensitive bicupin YhaK (pirin superfamily)